MGLTIPQLEERVKIFRRLLPRNYSTGLLWSSADITRIFCKQLIIREFDPEISSDQIDLLNLLRSQYKIDRLSKLLQMRQAKDTDSIPFFLSKQAD